MANQRANRKKSPSKRTPKTGRTLFKYSPNAVKRALEAIKSGMSVLKASKTYDVPRTTLRHKLDGSAPETSGKVGPSCVLGIEIEDALCHWLKTSAKMGFPINKDGLLYSVQRILKESNQVTPFKNQLPGDKWFRSFLKRHPELSVKQAEYINKARANITPEKIRKWFEETFILLGADAAILEEPSRIWNMDETAFYLNPSGGYVLAEKGKHVYQTSSNSDKENITTLITVNAMGVFAPSLTLFKYDRLPVSYMKDAPSGWGIGKSKNGWMTSETFYEYFANVFQPFLVEKEYKLPVIVFLDGHSSHLSLQLSEFCREHKIIVVCLYPNTTHILQPLDVALFYPLKQKWKKELKKWKLEHGHELKKYEVPKLLNQIIQHESFVSSIRNGFRACGLYPFDANNVDYLKCTLKQPETTNELQNINLVSISSDPPGGNDSNISHLNYLESKIEPSVLTNFKECEKNRTKPSNPKAELLFDIWMQFKMDSSPQDLLESRTENIYYEAVGDFMEFPFPEYENLFDPTLLGNSLENKENADSLADEYREQKGVSEELSTVLYLSKDRDNIDNAVSDHTNNNEDQSDLRDESSLDNEISSLSLHESELNVKDEKKINILSNILIYPSEENKNQKKKRSREMLPSVLTSDQWIAIVTEKEKKKNEILKEKERRKQARQQKLAMKINKRNQTNTGVLKKKIKGKKSVTAIEDDSSSKEDLSEEENAGRAEEKDANAADLNTTETESKTEEDPETESAERISTEFLENSYVIVSYETQFFPGKIVQVKDHNQFLISTMWKSGAYWKWPPKVDKLVYNFEDIQESIEPPVQQNSRSVYSVPEMSKYIEG